MKKRLCAILVALMIAVTAAGCTEADKVNANLSKDAGYFNCERRITVYNARTDNVILTVEGYMSVSNNSITTRYGTPDYCRHQTIVQRDVIIVDNA